MGDRMHLYASEMIKSSMGLAEVMKGARDTTVALSSELSHRQGGMAGDDDAGRHFSRVYTSAASTTLDQLGFSAYVLGQTGAGLMRTAREFMAQDSATAASIAGKQQDLTSGLADPSDGCDQEFLDRGQELPKVVGDTAWYQQYSPGRGHRFRGDPDKARDVAESWRKAGRLVVRLLDSAQTYASSAKKAHGGEAADSFNRYFKQCVGFADPPDRAQADETLVANLAAACHQLAKACDKYADHIDAANDEIDFHEVNIFASDNPFDDPKFGGNGFDGGLNDAVLADPHIHQLGDVAHALDSSQGRVHLPKPNGPPGPALPFVPLPMPRVPVPVPVPAMSLASWKTGTGADPNIPSRDPIPPDPNAHHKPLDPAEERRFRTWMNSLPAGGFAGGGGASNPDNAYQLRVAGYPERELPLPPEATGRSGRGLMADGLRPADGYAVEAKHVREPGCTTSSRSLDKVDHTLATEPRYDGHGRMRFSPRIDSMYPGDERELNRYQAAMNNPDNEELRGLEIVTNDKKSAAYWQSMMVMTGTKGESRYVP